MTINLSDNSPRVIYTVAAGVTQSSFTVPFDFFEEGDVNVYVDGVLKTITTDYTVSGGSGTGGTVTMSVTGISGGSSVVLTRDLTLERTTDFPTSGPFDVTSLNTELDRFTAVSADLKDQVDRALQLTDYDADANLTLPDLASRKGKVLAFDATTGDLVNGPSTAGVTTVAAAAADIATLADIQDGTVATNAITDAAAIKTNITTVAGIAANVTTVAGNNANVTTVAGINADVTTVAGNNANVSTVAGISGNVTTAAGISADITAVAADATNIGTVSTNIANVNTVAGISADVTTVAADGTDIGVVAGISSDVTTVSGIAANVTTVAGNTTNINAVAADATDIGTVATNIANVNTAAGISANITAVANIAADVTAAATNASDISAIAAEVAKVVTVANDLNEATSEIDVVANNIANVNLVGADIAAVINASNNLADINAFGDTYFISATAPASPTTGDLWFDTSSDTMKVYGASGFQNAGSSVNGTSQRTTHTATAGQTTFAATYDAGYIDVYLNGIKLIVGTDFTATSGTDIVLATGAAAGDTLDTVAYGTFSISNFSINDANDVAASGATNGQFLQYNGSNWVGGTVSTPTLSSLGLDNHDDITVDASGNVGIGTTTNNQSSSTASVTLNAASGMSAYELRNADVFSGYVGHNGTNMYLVNAKNGSLGLYTNNAERMSIDSSGTVGVGTTSPIAQSKLTVAGNSLSITGSDSNFGAGGVRGMLDLAGGYLRMGALNGGGSASGVKLLTPAGGEALVVDSSGRVTMPYQPSFRAVLITSTNTNTSGNYMVFESVDYNIGNHYNATTGIFTAPVAGRYQVSVQAFNQNLINSQLYVQVNNTNKSYSLSYAGATSASNQYNMMSQSTIFNLSANDTVRVLNASGQIYVSSADSNSFSCHLLG